MQTINKKKPRTSKTYNHKLEKLKKWYSKREKARKTWSEKRLKKTKPLQPLSWYVEKLKISGKTESTNTITSSISKKNRGTWYR